MEGNKRERWKKAVLPERDTKMGFYLNSRAPYVLYEGETKSRYFIDKTLMLEKNNEGYGNTWKNGYYR